MYIGILYVYDMYAHVCTCVQCNSMWVYMHIHVCAYTFVYEYYIHTCQRASNQVNFSIRSGIKEGPIPLGGLITHSPSLVTSIPLVPIL